MAEESALILVVEDEHQIRRFVSTALKQEGFRVAEAASAAAALERMKAAMPAVIVLDLGLPDREGADLVRELRTWSQVPVLVLSARTGEESKIDALDAGADDYLTKPFGVGELRARLRVMLRRANSASSNSHIAFGAVQVELIDRSVLRDGARVHLTPIEYRLLCVMIASGGRVLTHRHLLREVWGPDCSEHSHYLRVYMGRLRQKLEADPARPRHFLTETGVGYRFQH